MSLHSSRSPSVFLFPLLTAVVMLALAAIGCGPQPTEATSNGARISEGSARAPQHPGHVYSGEDIQAALDQAALKQGDESDGEKRVVVHAGVYRPARYGQALVRFNRRHDGITLVAEGDVVLTAANPDVARRDEPGYPAVVNHVVYFGDGVTGKTVLRGFKITGANNSVMGKTTPEAEAEPEPLSPGLEKTLFHYSDGGGIKVFGRSYPTIENVVVFGNYSSPCGAGVSVEHQGHTDRAVVLRNCIFRDNSCPVTGSAVDLLRGSSAVIENCLFVGNKSNCPLDERSAEVGKWKPDHGCGALTVFPTSKVVVRRCTFTGNRNAVDDSSEGNVYENCIFWRNDAEGGWPPGKRYELDVADASGVRGCFIHGTIDSLQDNLDRAANSVPCDDPQFDEQYRPRAVGFENAGYRP